MDYYIKIRKNKHDSIEIRKKPPYFMEITKNKHQNTINITNNKLFLTVLINKN